MVRKYPAIILLAAVVLGIVAADVGRFSSSALLIFTLTAVLFAVVFVARGNYKAASVCALVGIAVASSFRFAHDVYEVGPRHYANVCSEQIRYQMFGTVVDWPDFRKERTTLVVEIDSVGQGVYRRAEGRVLVSIADTANLIQRGDRLEWYGWLTSPSRGGSDRFDYRRFLNLRGISAIVYLPSFLDIRIERRRVPGMLSFADKVREWIVSTLQSTSSLTASAMAQGFLIGETRHIPPDIYSLFRDTGTLHVLAVSGSNVGLVIFFFYVLLYPFSVHPMTRSLILIAAIILFSLVSYGEPSVARASLMAILIVLARVVQRRVDLNQVVALTALLLLLWNPAQLFDVGFQLSFATAWGIVFVMSLIERYRTGERLSSVRAWIVYPLIVSVTAQLFSVPLTLYYFGQVPAASVVANIVLVPLISIATVCTLCLLCGAVIIPVIGSALGGILSPLMDLIVLLLGLMNAFCFPITLGESMSPVTVIFVFAVLVSGIAAIWRRQFRRLLVFIVALWIVVDASLAVGERFLRTDKESIVTVSPIPGGVMLILPRAARGDIIISGLRQTSFPFSEKILLPALRREGVSHIERLIIQEADVTVLTELLSVKGKIPIDTIFYPIAMRSAFADMSRLKGDMAGSPQIPEVAYGVCSDSSPSDGIFLDTEGIELRVRGNGIFISRLPQRGTGQKAELVVVSDRSISEKEFHTLHNETGAHFICADFAQADTTQTLSQRQTTRAATDGWLNRLTETGTLRIHADSLAPSGWRVAPAR